LILEHHILRDENWLEKTKTVFQKSAEGNSEVLTAAKYLGGRDLLLESMRRKLFAESPPSKEFLKWARGNLFDRKHIQPPI
jgi:predicted metallo-beta-lactamase superfamily hydrolase